MIWTGCASWSRMSRTRGSARRFTQAKRDNKVALAGWIKAQTGVVVSPDALFDVQIKRIHEYKRQLVEHPADRGALEPVAGQPDGELGAAGQDIRWQIGAGLCGGQGNHSSYQ